jgi:hypothetical protein
MGFSPGGGQNVCLHHRCVRTGLWPAQRSAKLTTHLHMVLRLRIRGPFSPFTHLKNVMYTFTLYFHLLCSSYSPSHTRHELPEGLRLRKQTFQKTGTCVAKSAGRFGRKSASEKSAAASGGVQVVTCVGRDEGNTGES